VLQDLFLAWSISQYHHQPPRSYQEYHRRFAEDRLQLQPSLLTEILCLLYPSFLQLIIMSNLVQAYERLLLGNVESVRSVESGLRNLTWLLPGRFEDSEIASEGRRSPSEKAL
jgi:hypothetical protein